MLDIQRIRNAPDETAAGLANKGFTAGVNGVLELDQKRRALLTEVEDLRSKRNSTSKQIGMLKGKGEDTSAIEAEVKGINERLKAIDPELGEMEAGLQELLLELPNVPHETTPVGSDESANVEERTWGDRREFEFTPQAHWDLGEKLGMLDFERGTKLAGSGFVLYRGLGARLERALWNFMLDLHTSEHGYTEFFPPFLANRATMTGTGQLPKMEDDMYRCDADDLFLIPTAEVPITNMYTGEILDGESLPLYHTGYTACFRREAGAAGRETRGMIRVHQFNKVEMVKFVHPDTSYDELESLLANAEKVLQLLELPYRILSLCSGDISFAAAKCYDIEAWAPGCERWLEVSSCSNFEDFQARRANIRFRTKDDKKPRFVHTLNGSGLALPRTMIAIMENYQQADGTIVVPDALRPYLGGLEILA